MHTVVVSLDPLHLPLISSANCFPISRRQPISPIFSISTISIPTLNLPPRVPLSEPGVFGQSSRSWPHEHCHLWLSLVLFICIRVLCHVPCSLGKFFQLLSCALDIRSWSRTPEYIDRLLFCIPSSPPFLSPVSPFPSFPLEEPPFSCTDADSLLSFFYLSHSSLLVCGPPSFDFLFIFNTT